MKKVLILFTLVLSAFTLTACSGTEIADLEADLAAAETALAAAEGDVSDLEDDLAAAQAALAAATLADLPAVVDMTNIDMYLGRPDVQYVDLRNFDDKLSSGYIAGFEMIPFFDYLEYLEIMDREGNVSNEAQVRNLFNEDAEAIFLMCGSGTRAGWVKDALDGLGYTNVMNIGGIGTYTGDNKVLGLEGFELNHPASGMYTPGTHYGYADGYVAIVFVGAGGAIEDVFLDSAHFVYGTTELLSMKRAYTLPEEYAMNYTLNDNGTPLDDTDDYYVLNDGKLDWWMQADALEAAVLANQGWDSTWTIVDGSFGADEVAGVSITVSHWMDAIVAAVAAATPAS